MKEGRGGKKVCFTPTRMFSFRRCEDTKLVLHQADRVSCLFPLEGKTVAGGVMERRR